MGLLLDVRALQPATRLAAAEQIRTLADFELPELDWFNSEPCPRHTSLEHGQAQYPPCRACGVRLRKHQRVGVAWLYMRGHGLIADQVGTGKTAQAAGLIACCTQNGELGEGRGRVVVVCRPAAADQWVRELRRFLPRLTTIAAAGTAHERQRRYEGDWDVLVIGHQMLLRDREHLDEHNVVLLVVDDVDELRSAHTQTCYALRRLARQAERVAVLTGTPLQKRLTELHAICTVLGGYQVFGSKTAFMKRYCREELTKVFNRRLGRHVLTKRLTGYQHLDEFKAKFAPFSLRRTPAHINDVELPVVSPHDVYLDLHPKQRDKYEELRRGVLQILKSDGSKRKAANAAFLYGQQICAGLATLGEPDGRGASSKLDWVEHAIVDGDLCEEKVIVFCHFTATVEALHRRLAPAGAQPVLIWGRDTNKARRAEAIARFWDDPACRVLIGTDAIEQSLNLQVSRHLINVDQLMNPARMTQLAGRIRRDGSAFKTVYVHNLLCRNTQEEGYLDLLGREQALADHIWDEQSPLYQQLDPIALLNLIGRPT